MNTSATFSKRQLSFIKAHPTLNVLAAVGHRSCVLFTDTFRELQSHIDGDKNEKFLCCEFIDMDVGYNIIASNERCKKVHTAHLNAKYLEKSPDSDDISNIPPKCRPNAYYHLFAVAGMSGLIKVLDLYEGKMIGELRGHTGEIKFLKKIGNFIASCSEDRTIRAWDITNFTCAVVIGGILCHKDQILTLDINDSGSKIISSGADLTIKQWNIENSLIEYQKTGTQQFVCIPSHTYHNIHKSVITKVMYYGNLIVSMSKHIISVIYSLQSDDKLVADSTINNSLEKYDLVRKNVISLNIGDTIFVGCIELYDSCQTFDIKDHLLISLTTSGDIYLFDLKNIGKDQSPFIVQTKLTNCVDFELINDHIYISTGKTIHKMFVDFRRFTDV